MATETPEQARLRLTQRLLRLVIAALVTMALVGSTLSVGAIVIALQVRQNTNDIETVSRLDTEAARIARYRNCEREQRLRAEQQFRAGLTPASAIRALVKQLGLPQTVAEQTTVKAVRARLPIFNCTPLLFKGGLGSQAKPLSDREQGLYVKRYAAGLIDPTP